MAKTDTRNRRGKLVTSPPRSAKSLRPSLFLEKLPAELRNVIYELLYDDYAPKDEIIHLRQPKPPTKALLLACKRTRAEARGFYLEAFRKYWREGKFGFRYSFDNHRLRKYDLYRIRRNVEHINHLHIDVDTGPFCTVTWDLVDRRGIWRFERQYELVSFPTSSCVRRVEYIALYSRHEAGPKFITYLHMRFCPTLEDAVAFCKAKDVNLTLKSQLYHVFSRQYKGNNLKTHPILNKTAPTPDTGPRATTVLDLATSQSESRFLLLPRELRDIIYEYAFTSNVNVADSSITSCNKGILLACKQTRDEALKLYYQHTIFHATKNLALESWLKNTPSSALRSVTEIRFIPSYEWFSDAFVLSLTGHDFELMMGWIRAQCNDARKEALLQFCEGMSLDGVVLPPKAIRTYREEGQGQKIWDVMAE